MLSHLSISICLCLGNIEAQSTIPVDFDLLSADVFLHSPFAVNKNIGIMAYVNRKNSHQRRWQIPLRKAAWASVNLAT